MASRLVYTSRRGQAIAEKAGSPGRIRTAGQAINSRLLYRSKTLAEGTHPQLHFGLYVWFTDFGDHSKLTLATISRKHIYDFVEHLVEDALVAEHGEQVSAAISRVLRHANEREVVDNPVKLKYAPVQSGRPATSLTSRKRLTSSVTFRASVKTRWPTWSRCRATQVCAKAKS